MWQVSTFFPCLRSVSGFSSSFHTDWILLLASLVTGLVFGALLIPFHHEIIRRRKKTWNIGNADVGPSGKPLVGFREMERKLPVFSPYLWWRLLFHSFFSSCFPTKARLSGSLTSSNGSGDGSSSWLWASFSAVGIFASSVPGIKCRRHAFIHPSYALSGHHGLFFGDTPRPNQSINFPTFGTQAWVPLKRPS